MKLHGFADVRDFWLHFGWGKLSGLVGAIGPRITPIALPIPTQN